MGDWMMENGTRSSHMGGFAYDDDNDAWVPMGDTPGSTPVWWRKYGRERNGSSSNGDDFDVESEQITRRLTPEQEELELELEQARNELLKYKRELEECDLLGGFHYRRAVKKAKERISSQERVISNLEAKWNASFCGGKRWPPLRMEDVIAEDVGEASRREGLAYLYADFGDGMRWEPRQSDEYDLFHYDGWVLLDADGEEIEASGELPEITRERYTKLRRQVVQPLINHFNACSIYVKR